MHMLGGAARHLGSRVRALQFDRSVDAAISLRPIGFVRSPYQERFGTPRQACCPSALEGRGALAGKQTALVELTMEDAELALLELNGFSHVWLITLLNRCNGWKPTVRPPPRTKSQARLGVLATRSVRAKAALKILVRSSHVTYPFLALACQPDRPNPIGLSACELVRVESKTLHVLGCDLLDGTVLLDIKPYVPYCDALSEASSGWAGDAPPMDYEGMRLTPEQERRRAGDTSLDPAQNLS